MRHISFVKGEATFTELSIRKGNTLNTCSVQICGQPRDSFTKVRSAVQHPNTSDCKPVKMLPYQSRSALKDDVIAGILNAASKYLNNIIEQDRRQSSELLKPMMG